MCVCVYVREGERNVCGERSKVMDYSGATREVVCVYVHACVCERKTEIVRE